MESYSVIQKKITKGRQKLLKSEPIITKKCAKHNNIFFLKSDTGIIYKYDCLDKFFFYKYNLQFIQKSNEKLALSIKRKFNTIKESFCNINTKKKKKLFSE